MTNFYDCFVDVVIECLAEFDCRTPKIKLIRKTEAIMNTVTRELDPQTVSEIEVTGVTVPYDQKLIDGTTILSSDIRLIIDSQQEPQQADDVIIDNISSGIISISPFNAGGVVLGYELQVRR